MHVSKSWQHRISVGVVLRALAFSNAVIAGHHTPSVNKDIVILGGGASGSYAAVRLREDYGKSVLLIEKESILGGHTNTYTDPETGEAFNYGVQSYVDYKGAKAFFQRFRIPLQLAIEFGSDQLNVDPNTGKLVPNVTAGVPLNSPLAIAALQRYYSVIKPWDDILLPGYWNFPDGDKIPADLLLPFTDFVKKYNLADMSSIISIVSGQDINTLDPTLFVVKNFGSTIAEGFLNNTFFDPAPFDNSLLYGNITLLLGNDLMLHSTLVEANRTDHGISIVVEDLRTGTKTQVSAKRLLVASEPSVDNLAVLGLDTQEKAVFNTWSNGFGSVYTAVLKTNLVPVNTSVSFVTPANSTSPPKPFSFSIMWNGAPGYFWLIFSSNQKTMNETEAKEAILDQVKMLYEGGSFPAIRSNTPSSEVVAISNHSSVGWGQSAEQLKAGFIQNLYALQGHNSTWYTGNLWCPDYSSHVWAFTDTVIPKLLQDIA